MYVDVDWKWKFMEAFNSFHRKDELNVGKKHKQLKITNMMIELIDH